MPVSILSSEYVFPVVGGELGKETNAGEVGMLRVTEVYGTAFCLSGNVFLTNDHVIKSACQCPSWGISYLDKQHWKLASVKGYESFSAIDMGIVAAEVPNAKSLNWSVDILNMLSSVQAVGFPYALDTENGILTTRSFRGTTVAARTWHGLQGKPGIYELSFPCPRGLSGAPLWLENSPPYVVGVVFGNSITDMIVYEEKEVEKGGDKTTVYQKAESLHLGMAIQAKSIVSINSQLLKMTIGGFLQSSHLLATS
jgi:hypothetical protein